MAHLAHYKLAGVAPMLGHYARLAELDRGYRRPNIDPARTGQNYAIGEAGDPRALAEMVRRRVGEARAATAEATGRKVRADANVLSDWVVTLPGDCPREDARRFFEAAVGFCRARYGAENVLGGIVHMDESTPHVHIPVVPVRDGRLRAAKVFTRADLRGFHKGLGQAVDAALGRHVSVELDPARQGEKQLSHLSQREFCAARDSIARAEVDRARAESARDEALREAARAVSVGKEAVRQAARSRQDAAEAAREAEASRSAAEAAKGDLEALEARKRALDGEVSMAVDAKGRAARDVEDLRGRAAQARDDLEALQADARLLRAGARDGSPAGARLTHLMGGCLVSAEPGEPGGPGHVWGVDDLMAWGRGARGEYDAAQRRLSEAEAAARRAQGEQAAAEAARDKARADAKAWGRIADERKGRADAHLREVGVTRDGLAGVFRKLARSVAELCVASWAAARDWARGSWADWMRLDAPAAAADLGIGDEEALEASDDELRLAAAAAGHERDALPDLRDAAGWRRGRGRGDDAQGRRAPLRDDDWER